MFWKHGFVRFVSFVCDRHINVFAFFFFFSLIMESNYYVDRFLLGTSSNRYSIKALAMKVRKITV